MCSKGAWFAARSSSSFRASSKEEKTRIAPAFLRLSTIKFTDMLQATAANFLILIIAFPDSAR